MHFVLTADLARSVIHAFRNTVALLCEIHLAGQSSLILLGIRINLVLYIDSGHGSISVRLAKGNFNHLKVHGLVARFPSLLIQLCFNSENGSKFLKHQFLGKNFPFLSFKLSATKLHKFIKTRIPAD